MSLLLAILQALVLFAAAPLLSGITRVARARLHNRRGGEQHQRLKNCQ